MLGQELGARSGMGSRDWEKKIWTLGAQGLEDPRAGPEIVVMTCSRALDSLARSGGGRGVKRYRSLYLRRFLVNGDLRESFGLYMVVFCQ